ncbi:MAG: penicillin acylase family protein, partial [Prolixibacteraceae bacterium]|nr:penicillin acylase family protein [Prolixibacteraceae bacterium]
MKILKRILLALLVLIVLVVIAGLFLLNNIKNGALPDYNKNVQLRGISSEVRILRDKYAIPHIYAENEADLYRAVGFAMAQDRLWQMDLLRRATEGRLSEMFGEMTLETDHLMRALRIPEKSEKLISSSDPEIIAALEAFADGVNQYMENNQLPPEFKVLGYKPDPWKPVHSINLIGYMSWDLTSGWDTELLLNQLSKEVSEEKLNELIPNIKNHPTAIFPDMGIPEGFAEGSILAGSQKLEELGLEVFYGSNNWAVAGKKSTSGKPLLANDMHLGLFAPGIWYQMHQVVNGKLNVTGLVLPGQPFVIAGHNDSIAWGMTNVMVDDLDFYFETLNDDTTKYLLNGEWKDLIIKNENIGIKGAEPVSRKILFTHRGPIVNHFQNMKEKPVSIHWLGNEMSNEIRTVFKLNRAHNWSDFRDAVKTFKSVSQNIVYGDVLGNIGLQTSAGVPIRKGNGIQVYPGDTDEYDWQGLVPFEQLPYEFNPERGYVSSANNKTVPEDYPYYISHWFATPDRINRIREMLEAKEKLGIPDFQAMQSDFNSALVDRMMPHFLPALENCSDMNETEKAAYEKIKTWDGNL